MDDLINDNFSCSLYFFRSNAYSVLVSHRSEPNFNITCKLEGCGATFTKLNSFTQHIIRKHQDDAENNLPQNDEIQRDYLNDDLEMIVDNDNFENNQIEVHNADNFAEINERVFQNLEFNAAKFIVNVKENCKVSQKT